MESLEHVERVRASLRAIGESRRGLWPEGLPGFSTLTSNALVAMRDAVMAGEWRVVPEMLPLLVDGVGTLRDEGVRSIEALVPLIPARALIGVDTASRRMAERALMWPVSRRAEVFGLRRTPGVWAMLTMHPDGFVREDAVSFLARETPASFHLRFLLLRLNDWVAEVREAARLAIRAVLSVENLPAWNAVLPMMDELRHRSRSDHASMIGAIEELYRCSESREELRRLVMEGDRPSSRWAMRIGLSLAEPGCEEFLWLAMRGSDPSMRTRASRIVRKLPDDAVRAELLAAMRRDRLMPVRREALYAALDAPVTERRALLVGWLRDPHATMRHAARVYLRDEPTGMDQFDPAELSREMIQAGDRKVLAGAIVSLGETGTKADAAWLRLFVSDPNEAIAGAAVQAVARLEGAASREWLLALMSSDGRERVVREAGRSLERPESEREVEQLAYVFRSDSPRHCRRAALTLLLRLNAFEALVYATEAMDSNDEALRQRAGGFMWRTRWKGVFTTPTESQRRAMEVALRAHGAALSLSERRIVMRVFGLAENP